MNCEQDVVPEQLRIRNGDDTIAVCVTGLLVHGPQLDQRHAMTALAINDLNDEWTIRTRKGGDEESRTKLSGCLVRSDRHARSAVRLAFPPIWNERYQARVGDIGATGH
jgi:hypothetical protein